jgi:hypothetical protein
VNVINDQVKILAICCLIGVLVIAIALYLWLGLGRSCSVEAA